MQNANTANFWTPHFGGGSQVSDFSRGGVPGLRFFLGGSEVSDFLGGVPVSVKGKIFDTRFGLIHVQTGKKNFVEGPPPVKGKIFDTRFGLIHVQTGKKNLVEGPPPSKGKNFWHQIWLDTCSDWKKNFVEGPPLPRNSKKLLWLRGGRYASSVHAGGLSCYNFIMTKKKKNKKKQETKTSEYLKIRRCIFAHDTLYCRGIMKN